MSVALLDREGNTLCLVRFKRPENAMFIVVLYSCSVLDNQDKTTEDRCVVGFVLFYEFGNLLVEMGG